MVDTLPEVRAAGTLAAFVSRPDEPATDVLLTRWRAHGRRVLLPVVLADLDLDWALDDGDLRPGGVVRVPEPGGARLGVDAIARADVVLVPALAVDRRGVRLGQGGGSYDRALARVRPDALLVALLHPGELLEQPLPAEAHDHPVHVVATVEGVVRLATSAG